MSHKISATALLCSAACTATALACLWDTDTLQMERLRFPGVQEIITGKFVRHSPAYYEWRIGDRQRKLADTSDDPALIDDLAVAYAKLGRPKEGIPLLEQVVAQHPERYETLSNLGTLLFFAGRLDDSKNYIRRALEINPGAHFGRERFQLLLTEYFQQSRKEAAGVMSTDKRHQRESPVGFAEFVLDAKFGSPKGPAGHDQLGQVHLDELQKATTGVLGMMHFADYRSPILLEALGDLLITGQLEKNASQLAASAYLSAAFNTEDQTVSHQFRQMAHECLADHIDFHDDRDSPFASFEAQLAEEIKTAKAWFAVLEEKEQSWITENRDVDREFAAVYYSSLDNIIATAEADVKSEPRHVRLSQRQRHDRLFVTAGLACVGIPVALVCMIIVGIVWVVRRRRARTTASSASDALVAAAKR